MNRPKQKKSTKWQEMDLEWLWEILLVITVSPAIAYGILSLNHLPVV